MEEQLVVAGKVFNTKVGMVPADPVEFFACKNLVYQHCVYSVLHLHLATWSSSFLSRGNLSCAILISRLVTTSLRNSPLAIRSHADAKSSLTLCTSSLPGQGPSLYQMPLDALSKPLQV